MKTYLPRSILSTAFAGVVVFGVTHSGLQAEASGTVLDCEVAGSWFDPATRRELRAHELMSSLSTKRVILLGESHASREDHFWQLQTLAALHAHNPDIIVGFEMFQRRYQPVLNSWSGGTLSEKELLEQTDWETTWGYDSRLYLPLFHFARQNRKPVVALNIDRKLVSRVGREGWDAIPETDRAGLSAPASASKDYLLSLASVFKLKMSHSKHNHNSEDLSSNTVGSILKRDDFRRFVDAQLTWDRAMAEAISTALDGNPESLVVGIVGRGHAEFGHGIPHQLSDLGVEDVAVLLPIETGDECRNTVGKIADAAFLVDPDPSREAQPEKQKLGVFIERAEGGIRILKVVSGGIAERSGVKEKDLVVSAAGQPMNTVRDLISVVQNQAPGTWLPLKVKRDGTDVEIVAKFAVTNPR